MTLVEPLDGASRAALRRERARWAQRDDDGAGPDEDLGRVTGLADHHCHVTSAADLVRAARWGVSTVVNMAGSPYHRSLAEAARGVQGAAEMETVSPLLDGSPPGGTPYRQLAVDVYDAATAEAAVRSLAAVGYTAMKSYTHLSAVAYDAIAATARDVGAALVGHVPTAVSHDRAICAGQTRFEHLGGMVADLTDPETYRASVTDPAFGSSSHGMAALLSRVDWREARRLARRMADAGVAVCPTLSIHQPYPERVRRPGAVPLRVERAWERFADDRPWRAVLLDFYLQLVAVLADSGVTILAGTDAPDPFIYPGASLFDELELLTAAGLGESVVWGAATRSHATDGTAARRGVIVTRSRQPGARLPAGVVAVVDDDGRFLPPPSSADPPPEPLVLGSGSRAWSACRDAALHEVRLDWAGRFDDIANEVCDGLRLGIGTGPGGEVALYEEEHSESAVTVRLVRSGSAGVIRVRTWLRTLDDDLLFTTDYSAETPGVVRCTGDHLRDRAAAVAPLAARVDVACGNFSLAHPVLCASRSGTEVVRGLWGGYPDHETAQCTPLRVTRDAATVSMVSLLYGGHRQRATLDDDGRPIVLQVTSAEGTNDWRLTRSGRGSRAGTVLTDGAAG